MRATRQSGQDAYGWPADTTEEDTLARLLALNSEGAAAQG